MRLFYWLLLIAANVTGVAWGAEYVMICQEGGQFGSQMFSYAMVPEIEVDQTTFQCLPYIGKNGAPLPYVKGNVCLCSTSHELSYFHEYREKIRELFGPSDVVIAELKEKYDFILNHPKTVAVHVRTYHPILLKHCCLGSDYYQNALNQFDEDHLFVIFSDRIEWCKKHLDLQGKNAIFIEGNHHILDFYLMNYCKNIITSNSTFSWWAAYLKKDPSGLIIAPKRWFYDPYDSDPYVNRITKQFYPKEWIILPAASPSRDYNLLEFDTTSIDEQ
ncbi:MAG: alpha-1,2-fucosyltransferase [Chlamydiia bacterium]|nr:alpha-1,2-fucosyltransferase [Chlamydiia bacterium]